MITQQGEVYRHVKTRGLYLVLHIGKMQTQDWRRKPQDDSLSQVYDFVDKQDVVVYLSLKDRSVWVRPQYEFEDGRFILT